jgi:uncharacterized cupredoxin-like copper-binding protein
MTVTEIPPGKSKLPGPGGKPQIAVRGQLPPEKDWFVGVAAGIGVIALAVAVVALVVAIGNSGSNSTDKASLPVVPAAAPAPAPAAFAGGTLPISVSEFKLTMTVSSVTAGSKTIQISNAGAIPHEVLVFHPDASIDAGNLPVGPDGDITEEAPGVNKISDGENLDPGSSKSRQVDLSQPGTYVFVCNLPGHYKAGMWTKVTVH